MESHFCECVSLQALRSRFKNGRKEALLCLLNYAFQWCNILHISIQVNQYLISYLSCVCVVAFWATNWVYLVVSNKDRVSVLCSTAENTECNCPMEDTGQSAGEGTSHIGNLAAPAKYNMSTAWLQATLIKNVIRGSISKIAHSLGFIEIEGLLIEPHRARAKARAKEEVGSWEALFFNISGASVGDMILGGGILGGGF